ncbi:hypothetical protein LO762_32100, partial [Actinocorallia sp. API 0066]|uniref:hypothetical protein n=1 Tax=Actinocorallia sp. API 0066 TaxID=2896846 RepID=UPI001E421C32
EVQDAVQRASGGVAGIEMISEGVLPEHFAIDVAATTRLLDQRLCRRRTTLVRLPQGSQLTGRHLDIRTEHTALSSTSPGLWEG